MKSKRIGITLVIVGLAGAAILGLLGGISESRAIGSFGRANVGCRTWFQFDKPGTYYVFVETGRLRVVDQGCPPSATSDELVLSLYADSRPIPLVPDASLGYEYDGSSAASTSRFVLETSGRFELVAVGPNVEQVIALGADPATARRPWWFAAGLVLTIGVLGGLVLLMNERFGRTATSEEAETDLAPRTRRPRLPASLPGLTKPKVEPTARRQESPAITNVTQEVIAVSEQPIVADTPSGTNRPISAPVVSSGSTAGISRRSPGRRVNAESRGWDVDDVTGETVGDALGIDEPTGTGSTNRKRTGPARRGGPNPARTRKRAEFVDEYDDLGYGLDHDEFEYDVEGGFDDDRFDDDRFDDDWSSDGWVGDETPRHDRRRSRRGDAAGRRARSPRPQTRNAPVGDYVDYSADYSYGPDQAPAERVEDYLDDGLYDDYDDGLRGGGDDSRGFVEDYLDDVPLDGPPREGASRRSRGPRGRSDQRSGRTQRRDTSRSVRGDRSRTVDRRGVRRSEPRGDWEDGGPGDPDHDDLGEFDQDGYPTDRSPADRRRTQPRRRRTPPPPPPPNDEWEELPPPVRPRPREGANAVVSDEWTSDGDDTGSWRWWSPPDPSDRAKP